MGDDANSTNRAAVAGRRDGLLALVLAQLTLLTYAVVMATDVYGTLTLVSLVALVFVGIPAFLGGLVLLAPKSATHP